MELTPAMKQYQEMKKQNADCILFFRIGDFYEVFFEDANICHNVLDLVLTSKNKWAENPIPMAWIPHHSIDKYIPKLIQHWYKVAIAEQITDPKPWKLVQRQITQIITPWTYIQEWTKNFNYMLSITRKELSSWEIYHLAWWDFTLGEYQTKSFSNLWDAQKRILTLSPTEIIIDVDFPEKDSISTPIQQYLQCLISVYEVPVEPDSFLCNMAKVQILSSFGQAVGEWRLQAIALLLHYIRHVQQQNIANISKISYHAQTGFVLMDEITIKNLEIFSSSYENNQQYSLFWILDQTKTSAGGRLLHYYLANPINSLSEIQRRQNLISHYQETDSSKFILKKLSDTFDLQKLTSSILYKKLSPIPFLKLRSTLDLFFRWDEESFVMLNEIKLLWLSENEESQLKSLYESLKNMLKSDQEVMDGDYFIAEWWNSEVDELRKIAFHSDDLLLQYQQFLVQQSWVQNVKLKFVMNQWYFIELTTKDSVQFEEKLWIWNWNQEDERLNLYRRNTLKWNQRYSSTYLEKLQENIITSREKLTKLENDLLKEMWEKIWDKNSVISSFAQKVAELDVFCSHAVFAFENRYIQPEMNQKNLIEIVWWRHPVIEAYLPTDQQFIPNDLSIWEKENQEREMIHIITWPNMWWKSTFLRQSALIVLLAHCGLFVPATSAKIWLVDGIFARVGSGDVIAKNQSTFMTEMIEVSNILNNATSQSFIIFDELGRGTSTYDGLALTSAILQYVLKHVKAKTLIATHYHELIKLEKMYPEVKNYSVSVYETDKEVLFMKKIVKGWASKSYWIDVAKIAWIPDEILKLSREILKWFESKQSESNSHTQIISTPLFEIQNNDSKYQEKYEKIQRIITQADLNNMTPIQAIQFLAKIKDELENKSDS